MTQTTAVQELEKVFLSLVNGPTFLHCLLIGSVPVMKSTYYIFELQIKNINNLQDPFLDTRQSRGTHKWIEGVVYIPER